MTDRTYQGLDPQQAAERVAASINLRKRKETRFVWLGKTAVAIAADVALNSSMLYGNQFDMDTFMQMFE